MGEREELLACPFCGSKHSEIYTIEDANENVESAYVQCTLCDARGSECPSLSDAVKGWNDRDRSSAHAQSAPDPWVDTRIVRFDDTIVFGHGGFDFDRWEGLRWEMHTPRGSYAAWKSGDRTWSIYGGPHGILALDRYASESEAKAEVEQYDLSLSQAALRAPEAADAGAVAPVAWRGRFPDDGYDVTLMEGRADFWRDHCNVKVEPLYASPTDAGMRERAAIARIVAGDIYGCKNAGPATLAAREDGLRKADAILALPSTVGETGGQRS